MTETGGCGIGHDTTRISCEGARIARTLGACSCARTRGDNEGFTRDAVNDLWVHAPCGRPTALYLQAIYRPKAPTTLRTAA